MIRKKDDNSSKSKEFHRKEKKLRNEEKDSDEYRTDSIPSFDFKSVIGSISEVKNKYGEFLTTALSSNFLNSCDFHFTDENKKSALNPLVKCLLIREIDNSNFSPSTPNYTYKLYYQSVKSPIGAEEGIMQNRAVHSTYNTKENAETKSNSESYCNFDPLFESKLSWILKRTLNTPSNLLLSSHLQSNSTKGSKYLFTYDGDYEEKFKINSKETHMNQRMKRPFSKDSEKTQTLADIQMSFHHSKNRDEKGNKILCKMIRNLGKSEYLISSCNTHKKKKKILHYKLLVYLLRKVKES